MTWTAVCRPEELGVGEARAFEIAGRVVAVFNVEGEYFATEDICTHEEASLSEGFLEDHLIECPLHGSQFDLRTGHVLSLPAVLPIKTYPASVQDGQVCVEISD